MGQRMGIGQQEIGGFLDFEVALEPGSVEWGLPDAGATGTLTVV